MKKFTVTLVLLLFVFSLSCSAISSVFKYHFPKAEKYWGDPVSFNNLSPGFFQVMFRDVKGVIRIATYGIAGGSMDTLKDPQLLMVFVFDEGQKVSSINNN
ncbi:hypothetical protein ACFLZ2_03850 [Candidatus Margulisiibacteriota bacterium]